MASSLQPIQVESVPRLALRRPEAAESIGVSERTLASWADVPIVRVKGTVMYPVAQLRDWLADRASTQTT